jgi:hypothetical protein
MKSSGMWNLLIYKFNLSRCGWLMLIILATQEITFRSQTRQIVCETLSQKTNHENKAGGVAQGEGPEFKPQYQKKKSIILI